MLRGILWALLLVVSMIPAVDAARRTRIPDEAEMTMLLTGSITVDPAGNVSGWHVDEREQVPGYVQRIVDAAAAGWKFDPVLVEGKPRHAKARMSLRMVAKKHEDGNYHVAIRGAYFGKDAESPSDRPEATDQLQSVELAPPDYPTWAVKRGVMGTAYVVLRVNREGGVEDAVVEQVNLKTTGSEAQQQRMREVLAQSALAAAGKWKFRVPTTGEGAAREYWSTRVPVEYKFRDSEDVAYGQWEAYLPGPWKPAPWRKDVAGDAPPDALVAGQSYPDGQGMKLLTPIQRDGS